MDPSWLPDLAASSCLSLQVNGFLDAAVLQHALAGGLAERDLATALQEGCTSGYWRSGLDHWCAFGTEAPPGALGTTLRAFTCQITLDEEDQPGLPSLDVAAFAHLLGALSLAWSDEPGEFLIIGEYGLRADAVPGAVDELFGPPVGEHRLRLYSHRWRGEEQVRDLTVELIGEVGEPDALLRLAVEVVPERTPGGGEHWFQALVDSGYDLVTGVLVKPNPDDLFDGLESGD